MVKCGNRLGGSIPKNHPVLQNVKFQVDLLNITFKSFRLFFRDHEIILNYPFWGIKLWIIMVNSKGFDSKNWCAVRVGNFWYPVLVLSRPVLTTSWQLKVGVSEKIPTKRSEIESTN